MPNPKKYKNQKNFMRDCMHITVDVENKDKDQGIAQCLNMWRNRKKKARNIINRFRQADDSSHINKIHLPGWPPEHYVYVCDSCLKGKHISYGMNHMPKGDVDEEDLNRYSCKNVGIVDGKKVQCQCSAAFTELLDYIKRNK